MDNTALRLLFRPTGLSEDVKSTSTRQTYGTERKEWKREGRGEDDRLWCSLIFSHKNSKKIEHKAKNEWKRWVELSNQPTKSYRVENCTTREIRRKIITFVLFYKVHYWTGIQIFHPTVNPNKFYTLTAENSKSSTVTSIKRKLQNVSNPAASIQHPTGHNRSARRSWQDNPGRFTMRT